jgi:hypothetical protein
MTRVAALAGDFNARSSMSADLHLAQISAPHRC